MTTAKHFINNIFLLKNLIESIMKSKIEEAIKTLLEKIKEDTKPNDAVSISIAVLNLANARAVPVPEK
jgi:hypothetical protein